MHKCMSLSILVIWQGKYPEFPELDDVSYISYVFLILGVNVTHVEVAVDAKSV